MMKKKYIHTPYNIGALLFFLCFLFGMIEWGALANAESIGRQKNSYVANDTLDFDEVAMKVLNDTNSERVLGDRRAPNTIIGYTSLACAHCSEFYSKVFSKIKADFIDTGKAIYIHRELASNRSGFFGVSLAYCVTKNDENSDRYYSLIRAMYKNQMSWVFNIKYKNALKQLFLFNGVSSDEFDECASDERSTNFILKKAHEANSVLKIHHSPVLIVNGKKLDYAFDISGIRNMLKEGPQAKQAID